MIVRAMRKLWRWLRRPTVAPPPNPYLGPVIERDGKVYEHLGPADRLYAGFEPPWL